MRTIERSSAFKRDYKRETKGPNRAVLEKEFSMVLTTLASDQPLANKYRDHALVGEWMGYRECHLKPDLLLIYKKPDAKTLRLARLGSHAELDL
jgi:mRNA interferase YafQ